MAKAKKRDYAGAVADYSAAIESPQIPPDVRGMALYNRALAYSAMNEDEKAAEDLAARPDYSGTVIPPNVAPLDFLVEEPGTDYRVRIRAEQGAAIDVASRDGSVVSNQSFGRGGGCVNCRTFAPHRPDQMLLHSRGSAELSDLSGMIVVRQGRVIKVDSRALVRTAECFGAESGGVAGPFAGVSG